MSNIILASASPRRRELMEQMGIKFSIIESGCDEKLDGGLTPEAEVGLLSKLKAENVAERLDTGDNIIIGADTIVTLDGIIYGKPKDSAEAFEMFKILQGKKHTVFTAVTLISKSDEIVREEETRSSCCEVYMKGVTDELIRAYVNTGEPLDKAGAYAIQGMGAAFIDKIEGDYYAVVGLPVSLLFDMLSSAGVKCGLMQSVLS